MASNGGEQAADELLAKTREYLQTIMDDSDRLEVVVRAFANLDGLASTLIRDGRIKDSSQLRNFFTGFSSRLALFDFVDVGAGKERADNKIRGRNPLYPITQHWFLMICLRKREVFCGEFSVQAYYACLLPRFRLRSVLGAICRGQVDSGANHVARGKPGAAFYQRSWV